MNGSNMKTHPLIVIAASAVILTCLVVIAVITGIIPSPLARDRNEVVVDAPAVNAPARSPLLDQPLGVTGRSSFADTRAASASGDASAPRDRVATGRTAVVESERVATRRSTAVEREQRATAEREPTARGRTDTLERDRVVAGRGPAERQVAAICENCGTVTSVRAVTRQGEAGVVGPLAGGAIGGLIGSQIGGGSGKAIATVVGAAGGAAVGTEIERRQKSTTSYVVNVRLNDGTTRSFTFASAPGYQAGDRIRVVDGRLLRDS